MGGTACEATEWVAENAITCKISAGSRDRQIGAGLSLTVGVLVASLNRAVLYDSVSLKRFHETNVPVRESNATVHVLGSEFGTYSGSPSARVGGSACAASVWQSDTSVSCRIVSGVAIGFLAGVVTVAGSIGTVTRVISYDRSLVTAVEASKGVENNTVLGGASLTFVGLNFGAADYSFGGVIGKYGCRSTRCVHCDVTR